MPYLSSCGYKNDVFVSYAHADNEPVLDSKICWVSNFIDDLGKFLARKLGRREGMSPAIWIDHELAYNKPLNHSLAEEIRNTAVYLVIMSPAYLASEWCKEERRQFFNLLREKGADTRVFIIEIDEIPRDQYPIELNEYVIPYRFWKKEMGSKARTLGFPKREEDEEYSNRLIDISTDLARELTSIKDQGAVQKKASPAKGCVFLAQVTDDLDEKREEIKRYLKDEGYRVLPEENQYLNYDPENLTATIQQYIADSSLYIQLLSNLPGKKLPGSNESITHFQFGLASASKKIMVWRSPSLDVPSITNEALKEIHQSQYVRAEGFEEFKAAVLEALAVKEEKPATQAGGSFVYICTDPIDKLYCEKEILPRITEKKFDYSLLESKKDMNVRKFQEQNLLLCDAALFVYCDSDRDIVFNQIMHCRKVNTERNNPFKMVAIYDGPPSEKDKIEIGLNNIRFSYLNCRKDFNDFTEKFLNVL